MKTIRSAFLPAIVFSMILVGCTPGVTLSPAVETVTPKPIVETERITPTYFPTETASSPTPVPLPATDTPQPTVESTGKVLMIFGNRFIREIYTTTRPMFEQAGYQVLVASRQVTPLSSKDRVLDVTPDLLLEDVDVADYDAIIFNCDNDIAFGSAKDETSRIIREALEQGKIIAAICAAPRVLGDADMVDGVRVTGEPSATCALLQSRYGAICTNQDVEQDGLIITARDRYSSAAFATKILETLASPPSAAPEEVFSMEMSEQKFISSETFQAGLGDLDDDGDLDAVLANPMRNAAEVWLNDGQGAFVNTGQQLTEYGHGVGLADFDGDGDLDAFIVCHQFIEPSKIYINDGHGNFQDTGQDLNDASMSAVEVNLLDLNGDGRIDVHVAYFNLPDKIYLNDGNARFSDSGLELAEETIAWGDLDGDGDTDYFGKHWGKGNAVYLNDGQGQFSTSWEMTDGNAMVGGVALADFDGDGDLDALVANGHRDTGSFPSLLLWNDGKGQFSNSGQVLNETMGADLATGDLDLDGDLDVFVANMDRPNEVWLNTGGQFVDSNLRLGKNTDMSGKPSLGDLDGDGDLDVVVGRFRGGAEIWLNKSGK